MPLLDRFSTEQLPIIPYTQIQNVTADRILGRLTVSGSIQELTAAQVRTLINVSDGANAYTHPAYTARSIDTTGAQVIDVFTSDAIGSVTNITTRTMTLADLGYTGASNADNYASWLLAASGTAGTASITSGATVTLTAGTGMTVTRSTNNVTFATTITQYTDALARSAISLTTTGNSGAATYTSGTGVLNIPNYTLAGLGGFANPMTTLGDVIYGGTSGAVTRLAGNTTTTKQYLSQTGTGTVSAAPTWSTIAGSDITGAALTKTDDTNVTLTLGGTPSTALLRAVSLTLGWTGQLAISRGGTGLSALGTANQLLRVNAGATALEYFTPSFLTAAITSLNGLTAATQTFSNDTNVTVTSATSTHTIGWSGQLSVSRGGTGASTLTGVLIGNGTSAVTAVAGTASQLLRRNAGNTAYEFFTPSFLTAAITSLNGLTAATQTFTNDTNVTITSATSTHTIGWSGQLSVSRGGTGASTLTGILVGNGTSAVTAVAGTASQLLRRNAGNTAYEFFTPTYLTSTPTLQDVANAGNITTTPIGLRNGDTATLLQTENTAASNASQFYLAHNFGNVRLGNLRGAIEFYTGVAERVRITDGGLCINTTSAVAPLTILVANSGTDVQVAELTNNVNASFAVHLRTDITTISAGGTGNMVFANGVSRTERMRITSGGNVLIGTSTDNGKKFQVLGTGYFDGDVALSSISDTANSNTYINLIGSNGILYEGDTTSATHTFRVNTNVRFQIGNGGIKTSDTLTRTAAEWKLADARTDTIPNANRLIRVEIAGVEYDILSRQVI